MISKEEVQKLAELARLQLTEKEIADLQTDMSKILDYVGQVAAASNAEYIRPDHRNIMRDDTPWNATDPMSGKRDAILSELPKREGDYNVVRKIIQKDE